MNISGRVISNQDVLKDHQRVGLKAPTRPEGKEHVTKIETPDGSKPVLNLNTRDGRNALRAAVRGVGSEGGDIYLRVSRTQVLKLHLSEPTTRRQLLGEISKALKNEPDMDIKFKAGLARVYHTLTTRSSSGNVSKYLKHVTAHASVEELDGRMKGLSAEFRKRMPESSSTSLRKLLREYVSPTEALEGIASKVYDGREAMVNAFQKVTAAYQKDVPDYEKDVDKFITEVLDETPNKGLRDHFSKPDMIKNYMTKLAYDHSAYDLVYAKFYNAATTPNPLKDDYAGAGSKLEAQTTFLDHLVKIAKRDDRKGLSNIQGSGKLTKDLDPATQLEKNKSEFFRFERNPSQTSDIKQRVYINVKGEYAPALMQQIVKLIDSQPEDTSPGIGMAKVSGPDSVGTRSDSIVVYTAGTEHSEKIIALMRKIQAEGVPAEKGLPEIPAGKELFGKETPKMTEKIMPGIAVGDEPDMNKYRGSRSYGDLRSEAMFSVAVANHSKAISESEFLRQVDVALKERLVNPERIDRNL